MHRYDRASLIRYGMLDFRGIHLKRVDVCIRENGQCVPCENNVDCRNKGVRRNNHFVAWTDVHGAGTGEKRTSAIRGCKAMLRAGKRRIRGLKLRHPAAVAATPLFAPYDLDHCVVLTLIRNWPGRKWLHANRLAP